jgi:Cytosolic carboxypeptidase N-terminal domain/Zinc carboxypeptidase
VIKYCRWLVLFALFTVPGCHGSGNGSAVHVATDFESGSIGEVQIISDGELELSLANDNHNPDLPKRWRNWWYVRIENLSIEQPVIIRLKNRGWPYYYLPVYSYDQETWHRFTENEVSQDAEDEITMEKVFDFSTVWIARFYPYTFSNLEAYIQSVEDISYLEVETAGTTQDGYPIRLLTLTDFDIPHADKKRIWMHARTHPAETGPAFLIEGLINFLLSDTSETRDILSKFIFNIVAMQNVDGVIVGNYRTTPESENLEVMWFSDPENPLLLTHDAPREVEVLHQTILDLLDEGPPVTIALNLHASNSEPDCRPFFFPHFGPESLGYKEREASLWHQQIRFIGALSRHYGAEMLEPVPEQGGSSFATKSYPESWWWKNFQDHVMAITLETTYGRAGYAPRWIEPSDLRKLGHDVALAIRDYSDPSITAAEIAVGMEREIIRSDLEFPELYPPDDSDELKE